MEITTEPSRHAYAPYGASVGWLRPTRSGALPPYRYWRYGTFIQSAIASNIETAMPRPRPVSLRS
jgi:hypothetical protein